MHVWVYEPMTMNSIMSWFSQFLLPRNTKIQSALAADKARPDREEFARFFDGQASKEIVSAVYNKLIESQIDIKDFLPAPYDNFRDVYALEEEDLDDFVLDLLEECCCRIPLPLETENMQPVRTVADVIFFVNAMRRQE